MKLLISHVIVLFVFCISAKAQNNYSVSGKVKDNNNNNLAFANILLLKSADSTFVKGSISSDNGDFTLEKIPSGNYIVLASIVGYQSTYSNQFNLNKDYTLEPLVLVEGEALDEVLIEAKKPLYQQKIDRMVINVENSIVSAGSSALEVLERSPGVIVDRQNNAISLSGKNGVVVMINDKISYMPQESIVQLLQGTSSDNIESIELITTPPANFDAEGNAGFINIVMKKRTDLGLNGSYSLSFGVGRGTTTSDNISFNYRKKKFNFFGSYSFLREAQKQTFEFNRITTSENNDITNLETFSDRDPIQRNHNLRIGIDIEASEKTIIGVLLNAYDNRWSMEALNNSVETLNMQPNEFVQLLNTERNQWQNFSSNFNLKHNFTENQSLNFDLDYLHYYNENPTDYTNSFFDDQNDFVREELTISDKTTPIDIVVGKLDYTNQINDNLKLETGIKGVVSKFENDVVVANSDGNTFINDPSLTNFSNLEERIMAVYTAIDFKVDKKTTAKVGLRYEHTDSELDTDTEGRVVDRNFGNLFPSVFLSHTVNDSLSFNASYSKRITRPTFNDMAPFVIFVDPTTFFSGNTAVQPSISNAFKFDTTYKKIFLSFQYTIQEDPISGFQPRYEEESNRLFLEPVNNDESRLFSITLGLPITIANWWKMNNNFIYINNQFDALVNGNPYNFKQSNIRAFSSQSFTMSKKLSSELTLNYFGGGLFGIRKADEIFSMNFGLQHKFGEKWGTLRFSINDIFDAFKFTSRANIPAENLSTVQTYDFVNRTFLLTYSRNFGNNKLKSARNRQTGSEEERRRVN